ncbi:hypothetical protein [Vibrio alfacsensis]|uniref:hypothetical protein n=1 Tax=Vibrio TaxID=662 RepID=UPI004068CEBB
MKKTMYFAVCFTSLGLLGCANDPTLGVSLNQLQTEQTLNPNAWYENVDYVPEGSGERTQTSLQVYNRNGAAKK